MDSGADFCAIVNDDYQRKKLTADLQAASYTVHDYMTAREFLIDKPNHLSGVVVADYRLQGMSGLELSGQLVLPPRIDSRRHLESLIEKPLDVLAKLLHLEVK